VRRLALPALSIKTVGQPAAFIRLQPVCIGRTVGEIEIGDEGEHDRRRRLDDEEPLPAIEAADAVHAEDQTGNGRPDRRGQRNGDHERADDAAAIDRGEPQGQIEDDAGEESGFRDAEQGTDDVERSLVAEAGCPRNRWDRRHQAGQDAPADHNPSDPLARAEAVQKQIRGHLEDEISEEEHAGPEAEHGRREAKRLVHGQRREADVDPVEIGDEIANNQERDQPPGDLPDCPSL
jgi:hypothetical protein